MARVDYDKQSAVYDRGRSLPPEAIAIWMVTARRHVGAVDEILDLGAGTGRFSAELADAFGANVFAVEPSAGMRKQAATKRHPRVHLLAGAAESLPLADASIDFAWLSNVIHHFDDIVKAAEELRRVVRTTGTVLVRSAFGNTPVESLYRFFPGAKRFVGTFPTVPEVIAAFDEAGFSSFLTEQVSQLLADRLADLVERTRTRADTTLELLSDQEFGRGMRKLEAAARRETGPVYDVLDVLVIR